MSPSLCIRDTSQWSYTALYAFSPAQLAVTTSIKRGRNQHAAQLSSSASSIYEPDRAPSFLPYRGEFQPIPINDTHRAHFCGH
ncbi:hypothetical protein ACN38_g9110 [Penicillium nordicum]|uniref:Uncharacterized protein n=1 Tax=Penicillium nordicum TaxID=229535 RepID=A0A0M9WCW8_9EURO|nr:hypothetical protein ACN38_g9110 [Penicillium nordicum]